MTLIDSLITATTPAPPKLIVYGQPGVGKTTFAASAQAVLIDCENGAGAVGELTRTPYLQTWPQMRQWLVELASSPPDGIAAVAVDTIDWMIQRIVEHVVVDLDGKSPSDITNTLGSSHGGYYKAREVVQNIVYRDLLPMLNAITDNGAAIILLAHAANTKMTTPEGYDLRMAARRGVPCSSEPTDSPLHSGLATWRWVSNTSDRRVNDGRRRDRGCMD